MNKTRGQSAGDQKTRGQTSGLPPLFPGILTQVAFEKLAARYKRAHGLDLAAIDSAGKVLAGRIHCADTKTARAAGPSAFSHSAFFNQALEETLRWGEPCIMCCPCGNALWAVPVMRNQQTLGGLLVAGVPLEPDGPAGELDRSLLSASHGLLNLAARENLTNTALLEQNRLAARRESGRAEALHDLKERLYDEIRSAYLHEEPALLAAIQRGERAEARGIINRILTAIYARGAGRRSLLKTLSLELVVMMARAAVQAGAEPEKVLGLNYRSLTELADVHSQEDLSRWLCDMLEQLIDAMGAPAAHPNAVQLARAVAHIEQHYANDLTRDEVARAAGLSPGHFSHLMREHAGATFTGLLLRIRLDNARRRLARENAPVAEIAQSCGFSDQSYFTRVFKKAFSETPAAYRQRTRGAVL
ncbi:AraC-like DNA-binding protein [Ereboglobus sp. PH5-10]|uniref:helix-turn-helix domain-containing protein n=1 Tax=Ereboglobus sp. PH5-10 TaxID=2940629 RepID=UPI0024055D4C|nr:helix-turn-helix domain-containing protein [Ereboglobus sp. PH5-10]MDF9827394.1 AraC-like DNA-binding protein [Ereboglobus sp. PH5-10]